MLSRLFMAAVWSPAGKELTSWLSCTTVCDVFLCFVTFPCGVLGQVWYLIVSIPVFSFLLTDLPAKSDSDAMFCLQKYQGLISDRSLVY